MGAGPIADRADSDEAHEHTAQPRQESGSRSAIGPTSGMEWLDSASVGAWLVIKLVAGTDATSVKGSPSAESADQPPSRPDRSALLMRRAD